MLHECFVSFPCKKLGILVYVQEQLWAQLTADFPPHATQWRVIELSEDEQQALVTAQLHPDAVTERLNDVLGLQGWSNTLVPLRNDAVGCSLNVGDVTKTSILPFLATVDSATRAQDAFVKAAESFGLVSTVDTKQTYWVDYDSEAGAILFEPEVELSAGSAPSSKASPLTSPPAVADTPQTSTEAAPLVDSANADAGKSEGQKAIDRLLERLKGEGLGLEAAKLTMTYQGYGQDPDASRELYSKLRALLKDGASDGANSA